MKNMKIVQAATIMALALTPALAFANTGDFTGGVAIGSSFAGAVAAPTNGLIVQGAVGIGTSAPVAQLDSSAGIHTGYDSTTCTSTNEGTQRYNTTIHNYEFCNGTAWVTFGGGGGVPSGQVAYFDLSSCPTGWIAADGTSSTVDVRGEFIRGLDDGRGVDPSRTLGSSQAATAIGVLVQEVNTVQMQNTDSSYSGSSLYIDGSNANLFDQTFYTVRPRNVALLACQKS